MTDFKPKRVCILFAPGAGADSSSEFMQNWADKLRTLCPVKRFDYPYMIQAKRTGKRRAPNKLPQLVESHIEAASALKEEFDGVILAGRSMGSRVGCHVAVVASGGNLGDSDTDDEKLSGKGLPRKRARKEVSHNLATLQYDGPPILGLICLGYPLVAADKKKTVRRRVLEQLETPILFVRGSRDTMCPPFLFSDVKSSMKASFMEHVVEGGDHGLQVLKRGELTQDEADQRIFDAVADFVKTLTNTKTIEDASEASEASAEPSRETGQENRHSERSQ